jgi:arginine N-succinyltransferase
MEIVRAVQAGDLPQLWELIGQSTVGLTTLQITREQLLDRVELAVFAFNRKTEKPSGEPYLFVMEDTSRGKLVGLSCVFSKVGGFEPSYHYRIVQKKQHCESLQVTHDVTELHLEKIHDGPTEIGSLFLTENYRGKGRGRLLSLARFLFMAQHPLRFSQDVIAEMRGVVSDDGYCPFWEGIGRHFLKMDFSKADRLSTVDKSFIEDLMPQHPLYLCLLHPSAREVIGVVHEQTKPALKMLLDEGFVITDLIDIFDGGPLVRCQREKIGAIARTRVVTFEAVQERIEGEPILVGTTGTNFKSCLSPVRFAGNGIEIPSLTAALLDVHIGESLAVMNPHPSF